MKSISQLAQKIIKDKKIELKPRWTFKFKEYAIWFGVFVFIVIGGLAMAVIIYMLKNNDWDLFRQASHSLIGFIFITLPYFWILLLFLFGLFTYYNFKHTKSGYRYALGYVLLGIVLTSLFLGFLFYNVGLGRTMDRIFSDRLPLYEKMMCYKHNIWSKPDQGLLAGKIFSEVVNEQFKLTDLNRKIWLIKKQKALVAPMIMFKIGEPIKVIGEQVDNNIFEAKEIRLLFPHKRPGSIGCILGGCHR